ncbi:hypothetical protein BGX27_011365 [Mortierella sp. AM989]|nr:hypothetical protein BGX27_011365 [Mortierella sp. AM989]
MSQGTPPPPLHSTAASPAGPAPELRINVTADQYDFQSQDISQSPVSEYPDTNFAPGATLAPIDPGSQGTSAISSRASSIYGGSSESTLSDSDQSISSLGGLNHVNDGVEGSTAQRRISRAFSSDDLLYNRSSGEIRRQSISGDQLQQQQRRRLSTSLPPNNDVIILVERESCMKAWLRKWVPAYAWLISPGYNLADLPDDIIAGITISTVVIPQSMAYAMLAPLPPVYGLYTSVVPILIYCIFGTSRHMHTGTFAITTLLLGQAVRGLMAQSESSDYSLANTLLNDSQPLPHSSPEDPDYEKRFIGMILMLSFVIGCLQVIMSFLRVGGWASKHLLPDALVGGFNTAAVFHIGTSQLKHFFGFKNMPRSQGAFTLIKSWIWIGTNFFKETNWYTVALGTVAIIFMVIMRKMEQKRKAEHELLLKKKEMFMVQQRLAVSAAIVRNHEAQRAQQRRREHGRQQKSDSGVIAASDGTSMSPYTESPPVNALSSSISLRTVNNEAGEEAGPSITFAPNATRNPSDTERAVVPDETLIMTPIPERQVYIPIPDILMAVILLTIVNVVFSLDTPRSEGGWGINVIGPIPNGLPDIIFPANLITSGPKEWLTLNFLVEVIVPMIQPALLIAVIIYVMSFSIAKQFGKRYGYKVDPNQEMFALGLASMGGSIFSGYACTGSLTRTAILSQSGGKTPLASMVGVATVTLTLICLTWCFERVPNVVLAAIVLVALQSLVMQITEPLKLWRTGQRKAALIWTVTFVGVLVISVELGIAIGITVVLLTTAFSWVKNRNNGGDEVLLGSGRRRSSRRMSQVVDGIGQRRQRSGNFGDATGSLLNNAAIANGRQRRRSVSGGGRLSGALSPVSRGVDLKARMLRTKWGGKIGSLFGMEQPIFSDSLYANTDDDDY